MSEPSSHVLNIADIEETPYLEGQYWGSFDKRLTPVGATLGVVALRVPPGHTACPFHAHQLEDEAFFVLSGRGVLRYGEELRPLRAGDCIYCPAGTRVAHQIVNTFDEDLTYLAIGPRNPNEVCVYPDSGKVMVRSIQSVGYLRKTPYYEGEPERPRIFELTEALARGDGGT